MYNTMNYDYFLDMMEDKHDIEYDEAKNEQGKMEHRINEIEETLKNARIIDESEISNETVNVGSKVKVKDIEFDEIVEYKIPGVNRYNDHYFIERSENNGRLPRCFRKF